MPTRLQIIFSLILCLSHCAKNLWLETCDTAHVMKKIRHSLLLSSQPAFNVNAIFQWNLLFFHWILQVHRWLSDFAFKWTIASFPYFFLPFLRNHFWEVSAQFYWSSYNCLSLLIVVVRCYFNCSLNCSLFSSISLRRA